MLNRQENEVMRAVYEMCDGKESCLVSSLELVSILPDRKYTPEKVEAILRSLELDDYFDLIESDRKGERMFVITLHANWVCLQAHQPADEAQHCLQNRTFGGGRRHNFRRRVDPEGDFFIGGNVLRGIAFFSHFQRQTVDLSAYFYYNIINICS